MTTLPESAHSLLVRTWFGGESSWLQLKEATDPAQADGLFAPIEFVEDRHFELASPLTVRAADVRQQRPAFLYIADEYALSHPVQPVLVISAEPSDGSFRCRADALYMLDVNLTLGNVTWNQCSVLVGSTGVLGGLEVNSPPPTTEKHYMSFDQYLALHPDREVEVSRLVRDATTRNRHGAESPSPDTG